MHRVKGDEEYLTAVVKPGEMKQQDLLEHGVPGYADDEGVLQQVGFKGFFHLFKNL